MSEDYKCAPGKHDYIYIGVVYSHSDEPIPGSGAHVRYLEDHFYCKSCLDRRYNNKREHGNTYQQPPPGAFPK